jgi:hypothetical protein
VIRPLLASALAASAAIGAGPVRAGHSVLPAQGIAIEGRIVAASNGAPLVSARIEVARSLRVRPDPVFTDREGRFALAGDADRITVSKPGYLPSTVAIDTPALEIPLTKAGAIAGRITDANGDAARGRTITAERAGGNGAARQVVATAATDDRGEYRLAGLPEGQYYVGIRAGGPPEPGREQPPQVFYPGASSPPQPITVATGEERWAIDVVIPGSGWRSSLQTSSRYPRVAGSRWPWGSSFSRSW